MPVTPGILAFGRWLESQKFKASLNTKQKFLSGETPLAGMSVHFAVYGAQQHSVPSHLHGNLVASLALRSMPSSSRICRGFTVSLVKEN